MSQLGIGAARTIPETVTPGESRLRTACPHGYFDSHWGQKFYDMPGDGEGDPTCGPTIPTSDELINELHRQGWGVPPLMNLLSSPMMAEEWTAWKVGVAAEDIT